MMDVRSVLDRAPRIVAVTVGLVLTGLVTGLLSGGPAMALVFLTEWQYNDGDAAYMTMMGAIFGCGLGAAVAPVVGWTLLRRVPFDLALRWCTLGATLGGVAGFFGGWAVAYEYAAPGAAAGSLAGVVVAASVLRQSFRVGRAA